MARAHGTGIIAVLSGRVGGTVFDAVPGGMVIKGRRGGGRRDYFTQKDGGFRASIFSRLWLAASESERMAWVRFAENQNTVNRLGVPSKITGYAWAFRAWSEATTFERGGDTSGAFVTAGILNGPTKWRVSGTFVSYPELIVSTSPKSIYGVGAINPRPGYQIHEFVRAPRYRPQTTPSNRFLPADITFSHIRGWQSFPALNVGISTSYSIPVGYFTGITWRRGDMYFYRSRVKETGKWASPWSYGYVYPW